MTELFVSDNTQILLPNGSVWGGAILNRNIYPGTGKVEMSFSIRGGRSIERIRNTILEHLQKDGRVESEPGPRVFISQVVDFADPENPLVELSVAVMAKPNDVNAVR